MSQLNIMDRISGGIILTNSLKFGCLLVNIIVISYKKPAFKNLTNSTSTWKLEELDWKHFLSSNQLLYRLP